MFISPYQPAGEKLRVRLDPSSLSRSGCAQNFYLANLLGHTSKLPLTPTEFGQAIHQAAAKLRCGASYTEALMFGVEYYANSACVQNDYRTSDLLYDVLCEYLGAIQHKDNFHVARTATSVGVELPFEHPFRAYPDVDFVLAGVIDCIGTYRNEQCFLDIKSTGLFPGKFSTKWGTSSQMMLYSWVLKQKGFTTDYSSPIIDAIFLRAKKGERFKRIDDNIIMAQHVDEYMQWLWDYCDVIHTWLEQERFALNRNHCATPYGDCFFANVCNAAPSLRAGMLTAMFRQREYNPAMFGVNE